MALTRLHASDIANGNIVDADDLNAEFNQLVNILNGTSADKDAIIKLSHATTPPLTVNQQGAGPIIDGQTNAVTSFRVANDGTIQVIKAGKTWIFTVTGAGHLVIGENLVSNAIVIDHTTGLVTFEEIPVGPNATPTLDNQLTRKKYIDDRKVSFSASFFIADPSVATAGALDFGAIIIPAGGTYTITQFKLARVGGTHTGGTSATFIAQQQGVGTIGTVAFSDANNLINTVYVQNPADIVVAENAIIGVAVSATVGTPAERNCIFTIEGFRTAFN